MATKITKIQLRRDTYQNWQDANPTLSSGEFGVESDTYSLKIGNGVDAWNDLDYFTAGDAGAGFLDQVLTAGNVSLANDMQVRGVRVASSVSQDKVVAGGFIGDLLPGTKITKITGPGGNTVIDETHPKGSIGDEHNRFTSVYIEGEDGYGENFLVFGQENEVGESGLTEGTGSLSYRARPEELAILKIDSVDDLGRVTAISFAGNQDPTSTALMRGKGYYESKNVGTVYTTSNVDGAGQGLRVDITDVRPRPGAEIEDGGILISAPGAGYEINQEVVVDLRGNLFLNYESDTGRKSSVVLVQDDFLGVTTQSIATAEESLLRTTRSKTRLLPEVTQPLTTQASVNDWFYKSLVQHEYLKPTVRDCVNNGPLRTTTQRSWHSSFWFTTRHSDQPNFSYQHSGWHI